MFRHIQYIKVETAATGENSHLFFYDKEHEHACSRKRSFCYKALKVQNAFSCVSVTQFVLFLDCCYVVSHVLYRQDKWRDITTTVINSAVITGNFLNIFEDFPIKLLDACDLCIS